MSEIRVLVKLFGKTFPVPAEVNIPAITGDEEGGDGGGGEVKTDDTSPKNADESKEKDQEVEKSDDKAEPPACPSGNENQKHTVVDQETMPGKTSKLEEEVKDENGNLNQQQKTMKKPDKILPCPRCDSLDTKFCYYNNYNVNQPRHFCKKCQRYWTAGGTMRNVPVGAGRRKHKNSSSHYRNLTVAEGGGLQTLECDISEAIHLKPNGTILSFGSDVPLAESMATVLHLAQKTQRNPNINGFHRRMEEQMVPLSSRGRGEGGEEQHTSGSSVTATDSVSTVEGGAGGFSTITVQEARRGYPPVQIPCFNGSSPWPPHPWNSAPAFCASGYPIPFYPPTAYWGCAVPGAWTLPWISPAVSSASSPNTTGSPVFGPNSPLGKHSRDGCVILPTSAEKEIDAGPLKQTNQDGCIWVPKTLRIGDPEEAARSSIWATMGIKNNGKADGVSGGAMFKGFHPKTAEFKNHVSANSQVLHANPVALSRSLNFQEGL